MTKDEFRQFVVSSSEYFGLKNIVERTRFDLWYEEIKNIPSASLPYIQSILFTEKDTLPRNIPKFVKETYRMWLSANPDKKTYQNEKSLCDECKSKGFLWFKKHDGNTYVARCQKCENWAQQITPGSISAGIPAVMSKNFILESGWTFIK